MTRFWYRKITSSFSRLCPTKTENKKPTNHIIIPSSWPSSLSLSAFSTNTCRVILTSLCRSLCPCQSACWQVRPQYLARWQPVQVRKEVKITRQVLVENAERDRLDGQLEGIMM